MARIGVDVGGSQIRTAVVENGGRIVTKYSGATSEVCTGPDPLAGILKQVQNVLTDFRDRARFSQRPDAPVSQDAVESIGLALPATLDEGRNAVGRCIHIPKLEHRRPAEEITRRTGIPCSLWTDVEAATWAEYQHGGQEPKRFLHLRIGTGVGVGLVIDGRIHRLDAGRTTHLATLVIADGPAARHCPCGLRGCLERYCSGALLNGEIRSTGIGLDVADLQAAYDRGDRAARLLVEAAADALIRALRNLISVYQPDLVNIGGGVVQRLPALLDEVGRLNRPRSVASKAVRHDEQGQPELPTKSGGGATVSERSLPPIESSRLGDDAGVIGAAAL